MSDWRAGCAAASGACVRACGRAGGWAGDLLQKPLHPLAPPCRNNHSAEYAQEVDRLVAELGYGDKLRAVSAAPALRPALLAPLQPVPSHPHLAALSLPVQLRVNIETCPVISEDCCVMDVPTLMIFKGGVEQEALRGRLSMQASQAGVWVGRWVGGERGAKQLTSSAACKWPGSALTVANEVQLRLPGCCFHMPGAVVCVQEVSAAIKKYM